MANLTIHNLDDTVKTSLRLRAAQHQCSMEEEARQILKHALLNTDKGLGSRIHSRFATLGGAELSAQHTQRRELRLFLMRPTINCDFVGYQRCFRTYEKSTG
jgi:plasmid stability protein